MHLASSTARNGPAGGPCLIWIFRPCSRIAYQLRASQLWQPQGPLQAGMQRCGFPSCRSCWVMFGLSKSDAVKDVGSTKKYVIFFDKRDQEGAFCWPFLPFYHGIRFKPTIFPRTEEKSWKIHQELQAVRRARSAGRVGVGIGGDRHVGSFKNLSWS